VSADTAVLEAGGLQLRGWSAGDAAGVLDMSADPAARQWSSSMRRIASLQDAGEWVAARCRSETEWAVCDAATGELVGRIGLFGMAQGPAFAEIGYSVAAGWRRRGVARRAVAAVTAYGFQTLGLARISLVHAVANAGSCAVATGAGYVFEGVERSSLDHGDGIRYDAHRHARLATDPFPTDGGSRVNAPLYAELESDRLLLRPPTEDDAGATRRLLADDDIRRWNPGPDDTSEAALRTWCAGQGDWSNGSHATFWVFDRSAGDLLGTVSLFKIDHAQADAEVGYRVASWARGGGIATEAMGVLADWAFPALELVRVELFHAVANPASCRVAEKVGFRHEGTLRQSYVYGDGSRHDEHLHARLAGDRVPVGQRA
jgi:RimJ/RimL family protein N-acetyltransferase